MNWIHKAIAKIVKRFRSRPMSPAKRLLRMTERIQTQQILDTQRSQNQRPLFKFRPDPEDGYTNYLRVVHPPDADFDELGQYIDGELTLDGEYTLRERNSLLSVLGHAEQNEPLQEGILRM